MARSGTKVNPTDDLIRREFKKARCRLLKDPDVKQYLRKNPIARVRLMIVFFRIGPTVCTNTKILKEKSVSGYRHLVNERLDSMDEVTERYAKSHSTIDFKGKPNLLCKYMPIDHAVDNVLNSNTKFGSIGGYRCKEPMECKLPIAPEMKVDEFMDVVRARIYKTILADNGLDINSTWVRVQDSLEKNFFVGCFSDGANHEHMWHEYAKDRGVCVWFEPDYSKLNVITYSDYLAEADALRVRYDQMMFRLAKEHFDDVKDDFINLMKEVIDLSYMSFYTKKPDFDKETEWRQIVSCIDESRIKLDENEKPFIIESIPGRIVCIESRLPKDLHEKMVRGLDPSIKV